MSSVSVCASFIDLHRGGTLIHTAASARWMNAASLPRTFSTDCSFVSAESLFVPGSNPSTWQAENVKRVMLKEGLYFVVLLLAGELGQLPSSKHIEQGVLCLPERCNPFWFGLCGE